MTDIIIIDSFRPDRFTEEVDSVMYTRTGKTEKQKAELLREHVLEVCIDDSPVMRIGCTPEYIAELVLGRLLTGNIIAAAGDVKQLTVSKDGRQVYVRFRDKDIQGRDLKKLPHGRWTPGEVFLCADRFAGDTALHRRTRSTHSCYLLVKGEIVFSCEDIGRHNAIDKVIGWLLLHGADPADAAVFTSGRMPYDMAEKIIRACIPVFISKEAATAEAVELAKGYGLTLIGRVRDNSFVVYSAPTV